MKNQMSGYLFGFIFSVVAAVVTIVGAAIVLRNQLIRCFMSLGCLDDSSPGPTLLLMLGGYLLVAAVLALLARQLFNSRAMLAFLINVAPLVVIVSVLYLRMQYRDYAWERDVTRGIRTAISDAPAIHLGESYVKMVESPTGGVIL